jgi:hypothetical protein
MAVSGDTGTPVSATCPVMAPTSQPAGSDNVVAGFVTGRYEPSDRHFAFIPSPEVDVEQGVYDPVVATLRSPAPSYWESVAVVSQGNDLTGVQNAVYVEGWVPAKGDDQNSPYGMPVHRSKADPYATGEAYEGQDRFTGYEVAQVYVERAIEERALLQRVADRAYLSRPAGWPTMTVTAPRAWAFAPHQYVRVVYAQWDAPDGDTFGDGDYYCLITGQTNQLRLSRHEATLTLRVVGYYGNPGSPEVPVAYIPDPAS